MKKFECPLEYGDFIFTFPRVKHVCGPGSKDIWNTLYVSYSGPIFDIYYQQKYFSSEQPVWHLEYPEPWIVQLQELLREYPSTNKTVSAAKTAHFLALILEMKNAAFPKPAKRSSTDWFEQACFLLTVDTHDIDLPAVARKLGMSYSSFRFRFSQRAGVSPYQYYEQKRIKAACEYLMRNPKKLLKEISYSLGYSRADHFARQFKKYTGMLPGEYRRKFGKTSN
jgi:AraC-like DNA-binding protein